MRCFLVRHGITDACIDPSLPKDVMMNDQGRRQIRESAQRLWHIIQKDASNICIYCSPTKRTTETAHILQDVFQTNNIPVHHDERLLNKSNIFFENITDFISHIKMHHGIVIAITHGRIIKMMYSIMECGRIDTELTDRLELDYGDVFEIKSKDKERLKFFLI